VELARKPVPILTHGYHLGGACTYSLGAPVDHPYHAATSSPFEKRRTARVAEAPCRMIRSNVHAPRSNADHRHLDLAKVPRISFKST
jgi:hypothetical protein